MKLSQKSIALLGAGLCLGLVAGSTVGVQAAEPLGGFFAVLNTQSNNSDSPKSVIFYDTDEIASGAASPLFSVNIPGDRYGASSYNRDEPSTLAVDPATGDIYVLAFDSGNPDVVDFTSAAVDSPDDNDGDWDLFKIDFGLVYDHWSSNFEGTTVTRIPDIDLITGPDFTQVSGRAPNVTAGAPAGGFDDYITYNATPRYNLGPGFGLQFDSVSGPHSNTFQLADSVTKIGEIKRNTGDGSFYNPELMFIDQDTLLLIDNSDGSTDTAETDHEYRLIERVATTPGFADDSVKDHLDGGFNNGVSVAQPFGSTESWNSTRIGKVNLDFAETSEGSGVFEPIGNSEVESGDYYDNGAGVRGFWVTESDSTGPDAAFPNARGDSVAFYDIDAQAYRPLSGSIQIGGGGTTFTLDNDPFNDDTMEDVEGTMVPVSLNDGQADNIFVDSDTGDIIIVESGFGDGGAGITPADTEPGILRLTVSSYDDNGSIVLGAWSEKTFLDPDKNDGGNIDPDTGEPFVAFGGYSTYDSENDLVYFFNPGGPAEYNFGTNGVDDGGPDIDGSNPGSDDVDAGFQMDILVLDINTGVTTSTQNVDESVGFLNAFGDFTEFFSLEEPAPLLAGDYNADGTVNAIDYAVWRDAFDNGGSLVNNETASPGVVDEADYTAWANNFGATAGAASAVPEPGAVVLAGLALAGLVGRRR